MDIRTNALYATNAQKSLYEFLLDKSEACCYEFESLSLHNSIRKQLGHMIGAEQRWIVRIEGQPQPERYEDNIPASVHAVHADWQALRDRTLTIIQGANADELHRSIHVTLNWNSYELDMTVEEILFHVLNHENYHRGQCSMFLQMQNIDPPNFDYIFLRP